MKTKLIAFTGSLLALIAFRASGAVETYNIDPVHSSIAFNIRHLVSRVPGNFTKFSGTITVDRENMEKSSAEATIDTTTVNTGNEGRDKHLKTPDFFDAEKYPTITFKSKSWKKTGNDTFDVVGDLTIKGVTKEVVLKTTLLGFGKGMKPGQTLAGWEATTVVHRPDFAVNGPENIVVSKMLGDDVSVTINVESGYIAPK